jgi:hypothetical protein
MQHELHFNRSVNMTRQFSRNERSPCGAQNKGLPLQFLRPLFGFQDKTTRLINAIKTSPFVRGFNESFSCETETRYLDYMVCGKICQVPVFTFKSLYFC